MRDLCLLSAVLLPLLAMGCEHDSASEPLPQPLPTPTYSLSQERLQDRPDSTAYVLGTSTGMTIVGFHTQCLNAMIGHVEFRVQPNRLGIDLMYGTNLKGCYSFALSHVRYQIEVSSLAPENYSLMLREICYNTYHAPWDTVRVDTVLSQVVPVG